MSITMQQVLAEIDREEPNYAAFAALGADALPHLQMIVDANDALRSAKAAYAARALPALPAEGTASFRAPSSRAIETATAMPRALKLCVGFRPSSLM